VGFGFTFTAPDVRQSSGDVLVDAREQLWSRAARDGNHDASAQHPCGYLHHAAAVHHRWIEYQVILFRRVFVEKR
jgi:hypothetical protein